jgi:hypothetical protein
VEKKKFKDEGGAASAATVAAAEPTAVNSQVTD